MTSPGRLPALLAAVLQFTACSATQEPDTARPRTTTTPSAPPQAQEPEAPPTEGQGTRPRDLRPADFPVARAERAVQHLAGTVGPRHATSAAYRRAADWVAGELTSLGYDVRREPVAVPAGDSWGVAVPAGRSWNVVATPRGFDDTRPHLVVGAHLDTVPAAPGAEDNASGVGVLLASAGAASHRSTRLPVVWVAFGAEEPRGPGDDDHHYGSRAHVAALRGATRRAVRGMVSLDRVGVGARVPVASAGEADPVQRELLAAARRAGVPAVAEPWSRSSDHWSYVRAGLPGARLGSTPYAAYHSAQDLPRVVDPAQLERTGRLLLAWLAPR